MSAAPLAGALLITILGFLTFLSLWTWKLLVPYPVPEDIKAGLDASRTCFTAVPDNGRGARIGVGIVIGVLVAIYLGSGVFVVQEMQVVASNGDALLVVGRLEADEDAICARESPGLGIPALFGLTVGTTFDGTSLVVTSPQCERNRTDFGEHTSSDNYTTSTPATQ